MDDKISKIIWTNNFVEYQGWNIKCNIIFQDNRSAINLLNNCREISGERTRHFCIRLFHVKYLIGNEEVKVMSCPTERIIADYDSKPLVGGKLKMFR